MCPTSTTSKVPVQLPSKPQRAFASQKLLRCSAPGLCAMPGLSWQWKLSNLQPKGAKLTSLVVGGNAGGVRKDEFQVLDSALGTTTWSLVEKDVRKTLGWGLLHLPTAMKGDISLLLQNFRRAILGQLHGPSQDGLQPQIQSRESQSLPSQILVDQKPQSVRCHIGQFQAATHGTPAGGGSLWVHSALCTLRCQILLKDSTSIPKASPRVCGSVGEVRHQQVCCFTCRLPCSLLDWACWIRSWTLLVFVLRSAGCVWESRNASYLDIRSLAVPKYSWNNGINKKKIPDGDERDPQENHITPSWTS